MTIHRIACLLLACLALAACSGAPDADDAEQAMQRRISENLMAHRDKVRELGGEIGVQAMDRIGIPKPDEIRVSDVVIEHSLALDNGDYELDISYQLSVRGDARPSSATVILGQRDGEWTIIR